ncbi:trehalose operon repressor [Streptococcaceae bacterium ESL0729]|nr:trehalose operon repressor [Streptococcaceae bacterium ESL0729]
MNKYELIAQDLKEQILNNTYPSGSFLPSESILSNHYQASRSTIRQALNILETRGYIQKQMGKGSLVISSDKLQFPLSGLTSYKELQQNLDFKSLTTVIDLKKIKIDSKLSALTRFPLNQEVWSILRLRTINGKSVVLDQDYLLCSIIPHMTEDIAQNSLYEYLEGTLNLDISYAQKEVTIDFLNDFDKEYIDLSADDHHVVNVKSHVFLSNAQLFQYTESHHQVDTFRFSEFARREKI